MAGLTNIFGGGDDSNSSNQSEGATHTMGDATNALGLDVNSDQSNSNQDEDGNSSSQTNSNSVGLDSDTDGLLHSVTDGMTSSDESDS